jgi:hypothetical protein
MNSALWMQSSCCSKLHKRGSFLSSCTGHTILLTEKNNSVILQIWIFCTFGSFYVSRYDRKFKTPEFYAKNKIK